ncbi:MAG TPA: ATP synthase F1 subunit epsilon [Acidimicrobiia bacterium]
MADANPTLELQVVSPERVLYEGRAEMVVCRTADGEIAFLPGHVPLLGSLGIAKVRALLPDHAEQVIAVHGGFVEVSHDRVIVLSDVAELPEQIDVARAEASRARAQAALASDETDEEALAALARADLRLDVAGVTTS